MHPVYELLLSLPDGYGLHLEDVQDGGALRPFLYLAAANQGHLMHAWRITGYSVCRVLTPGEVPPIPLPADSIYRPK